MRKAREAPLPPPSRRASVCEAKERLLILHLMLRPRFLLQMLVREQDSPLHLLQEVDKRLEHAEVIVQFDLAWAVEDEVVIISVVLQRHMSRAQYRSGASSRLCTAARLPRASRQKRLLSAP